MLFTHRQHAREHLTVEQALYTLRILTDEYGTNTQIASLVDSREIWMVFDMNSDSGEHDIATGAYRSWRKNRQPNSGPSYVGTDLNRNWDYRWGCCGGSSSSTNSETYRGPAAFSAPETALVRDFVNSRVVGGEQQISVAINIHSYSELILWPYGYTTTDAPSDMRQLDHDTMVAMGQAMAASNGYELAPTNAYADDGVFAVDNDFGVSLPGGATVAGIELRLDARADSATGAPRHRRPVLLGRRRHLDDREGHARARQQRGELHPRRYRRHLGPPLERRRARQRQLPCASLQRC